MCGGGGGGGATITSPNYKQANEQAALQLKVMKAQRTGVLEAAQVGLNMALQGQELVLEDLAQVKTLRANETQANADRLANLLGPPAPEKTAEAPKVADARTGQKRAEGKRLLRINRASTIPDGVGVGLNIT
jgi:hypothetical protein